MREEDFSEWVRYRMTHRESRDGEGVASRIPRPGRISDVVFDLTIIVAGFAGVVFLLRVLVGAIGSFSV